MQIVCEAPRELLVERFERRIATGERHPGHADASWVADAVRRLRTERWDALDLGGPVVRVDTSQDVDLSHLLSYVSREMASQAVTTPSSGSAKNGLEQFKREYRAVRRAEGWGSPDGEYYRALPYRDLTRRFDRIWRIRARSFETFVERVLRPMEDQLSRPLNVLDIGAGNAWLAYRLAQRGHRVAALDLFVDALDGLGAAKHYGVRFLPVQAEFDNLPAADASADLAVFNAALHYSPDCAATLREALRTLRSHGAVVVLDTPFYRAAASGEQMVSEREQRFAHTFGFKSNALNAEHFLTRARLDELGTQVGLRWRVLEPPRTWRGTAGRRAMEWRMRRETAQFPVIVGTRS